MSAENVILVTIRDKVATADKTIYVCGNSGFAVNFDFDSEWDEFETKTARFVCDDASYVDVLFDGTVCPVPIFSNTRRVRVGVYAGNLVTTTPAYITASKSILCDGGTPADPPDDVYDQLMEKLNNLSEEGLSGRIDDLAEQVAELSKNTGVSDRVAALEQRLEEHINPYVNIAVTPNGMGTYERGVVIDAVTVGWSINRNPQRLTISGPGIDGTKELAVTNRNYAVPENKDDKLGITWENTSGFKWTITAIGEREEVSSKQTAPITFLNGVYFGAAAQPASIDSAFVLSLTKKLASGKVTSFTANAGANQYIWYCLPVRSPFGKCTFKVGGFEGGFALATAEPIEFENASGYTEAYYVYRSDESNLGNTTVGVS